MSSASDVMSSLRTTEPPVNLWLLWLTDCPLIVGLIPCTRLIFCELVASKTETDLVQVAPELPHGMLVTTTVKPGDRSDRART